MNVKKTFGQSGAILAKYGHTDTVFRQGYDDRH